jgi:pimeloyl-ACP methyl ester carboxylesterase
MHYLCVSVFLFVYLSVSFSIATELESDFSLHTVGTIGSSVAKKPVWQKIISYNPSGVPDRANPPECSALKVKKLVNLMTSSSDQAALIQDYFNLCGKTISRFGKTDVGALFRSFDTVYDTKNRSDLHEVIINVQTGFDKKTKVRGILALKNSQEKRPLIIAICGTDCNTTDDVPKQMLMTLFDSTPFNLLILGSNTGSDFIKDNQRLDFGGLSEGREAFEIAKLISESSESVKVDSQALVNLNSVTSSIHFFGMSLGGHASLYAGLYASANPLPKNAPQIQSVFGYCPVVDLGASIGQIDQQSDLWGHYFQGLMWSMLNDNQKLLGFSFEKPLDHAYKNLIGKAIVNIYKAQRTLNSKFLAPLADADVSDVEKFWNVLDFKEYSEQVSIPTLLFGAEDDPIVSPQFNSLAVRALLKKKASQYLGVVTTPKGIHCETQMFYGLDVFTSFITNYFLSHSPEFKQHEQSESLRLSTVPDTFQIEDGEKFFGYRWGVSKKNQIATLNIKVFSPKQNISNVNTCNELATNEAYNFPEICFREIPIDFQLSQFFAKIPNLESESSVQATVRWLNMRVLPMTSDNNEIINTTSVPTQLKWLRD